MKNEPLDYFKSKNDQTYALKSYRKLIIVVILLIAAIGLTALAASILGKVPFLVFGILLFSGIALFIAIPFFSFWGLINIFQSYDNREEKTTRRAAIFTIHIVILSICTCLAYWLYSLPPFSLGG